jgi:hypothetical protein
VDREETNKQAKKTIASFQAVACLIPLTTTARLSSAQLFPLRTRLLLLLLPERPQGNTGNLDGLELNSGNITDGATLATEAGNQNLIVDFNVVQAAVVRDKGSNLLGRASQLDTDALTDGRVGLLRLNTTIGLGNESGNNVVSNCVAR